MGKMTYTKLINQSLEIYSTEGPLKAYEFITQNCKNIKINETQIYNFRYCFACLSGNHELAMKLMNEAIDEKGYWYSYDYLLGDDDLEPLRKNKRFEELANMCREREKTAKEDTKPDIKIIRDEAYSDKPNKLLIALHGNGENISLTEDYWNSWVKDNNILGLIQSSQIDFSDGYKWDDIEKGSEELKQQYNKILSEANIDKDNVIIGAFSAGTSVALHAILNDNIKVKGFIFVGPWLPKLNEWESLINILKAKKLKGYIICGKDDEDCLEGAQKLIDLLNKNNVPNTFKIIEGLSHDYPDNFDEFLKAAIEFIG